MEPEPGGKVELFEGAQAFIRPLTQTLVIET